ncbi:MAG: arginine deiminase family protein [Acidobacteriota bacterium]
MYRNAIVRPPADNFGEGLTTVELGRPSVPLALEQHERYCEALIACGLALTRLPADPRHPDSTFVEDAAVLTPRGAILTRPGAASRAGEVASIEEALSPFFRDFRRIQAPGTLDGGDVCEAGDHFFIGVSARTNEEGARQLAALLREDGFSSTLVDIRGISGILHLKSGIAWLDGRTLVVIDALAGDSAFHGWDRVPVEGFEDYAANCVRINDAVLFAAGFPLLERALRERGQRLTVLPTSEFQKMDGGLSCLSLRF